MFVDIEQEIHHLGSEELIGLFRDTSLCTQGIQLEIVPSTRRANCIGELQPAATIVPLSGQPVIRIAESLPREERREAIAHECGHLLLVYHFGLGLVRWKMPSLWRMGAVAAGLPGMGVHGDYLLRQVTNTVHHLMLVGYLRNVYHIESRLHLHLLHRNFLRLRRENHEDRESLYARGLVTFECQRCTGQGIRFMPPGRSGEITWRSYVAARIHFWRYTFQNIPSARTYEQEVVSFLEDLGYGRGSFLFLPEGR